MLKAKTTTRRNAKRPASPEGIVSGNAPETSSLLPVETLENNTLLVPESMPLTTAPSVDAVAATVAATVAGTTVAGTATTAVAATGTVAVAATATAGATAVEHIAVADDKSPTTFERNINRYFEAETAAVHLTKPWLRLERGIRLQKFRAFAEAYPGLNTAEKETLNKVLAKANDAKLLNTKQQIAYEGGVIQSVKGLKIIRTGNPAVPAVFKIDVTRPTKKNLSE